MMIISAVVQECFDLEAYFGPEQNVLLVNWFPTSGRPLRPMKIPTDFDLTVRSPAPLPRCALCARARRSRRREHCRCVILVPRRLWPGATCRIKSSHRVPHVACFTSGHIQPIANRGAAGKRRISEWGSQDIAGKVM